MNSPGIISRSPLSQSNIQRYLSKILRIFLWNERLFLCLLLPLICILVLSACTSSKQRQPAQSVSTGENTILFAGDSIMCGLGPVLAQHFSDKYTCIQAGKVSSGLCNTGFYNWPVVLENLMKKHNPRYVVFCIGTNDTQPLKYNGNSYKFREPGWTDAYMAKVRELNTIIKKYHAGAIWLSPPVMGRESLYFNVFFIGKVIQKSCEKDNVPFMNTWAILADHRGRFLSEKEINGRLVKIRYKDKVHITAQGNRLFAEQTIPFLRNYIP